MIKQYIINTQDYKVLNKISTGTFGFVVSVENKKTKEIYAAKIIHSSSNSTNKMMINREIGIMTRAKHPTIIKFYGYSLTDFDGRNNVTIFMQLASKGSLLEQLEKAQQGLADKNYNNTAKQKILIGISCGMKYLHQQQIFHRDLKPGNILLDDDLEPHITDFGLSKFHFPGQTNNQSLSAGTSIYMAPEIIESGKYNMKADVYSFGILMYEVVADQIPYPDYQNGKMTLFQFTNKIVNQSYRPVFNFPIKNSIKELIEQCWSKIPDERPTFSEIFNRLSYNVEENVYDVFSAQNGEGKYYLEGVDEDEILLYLDKISESENAKLEIDEMRQKVRLLEEKAGETSGQVRALCAENAKLREESEKSSNLIKKLTSEKNELKNEIQEIKAQTEKTATYIKKLVNKNEELKSELQEIKSQTEKTAIFVKKLINENDELKNEISAKKTQTEKTVNPIKKPLKVTEKKSMISHSSSTSLTSSSSSTSSISIPYSAKSEFHGIFDFLQQNITKSITSEVAFTSSSDPDLSEKYAPSNVVCFGDKKSEFCTNGESNAWICFDFKTRRVAPTHYTIRAFCGGECSYHPRSWSIQASNDAEKWKEIDRQRDCPYLNGPNFVHTFEIDDGGGAFYRYLRILQTGDNWSGGSLLNFNCIEFYGAMK